MKHKLSLLFAIIITLACITLMFGGGGVIQGGQAQADALVFSVASITAQNEQGGTVTIAQSVWARHITINYNCNYPYLRLFLRSASGWIDETDYIVPTGAYSLPIPQEGVITVVGRVYNNHKIEQTEKAVTVTVYMDNTAPLEPDVDLTALDSYHINSFPLRYKIHRDNYSGVDYYKSWLSFMGEDGQSTIEQTTLAALIPPTQRELDNYLDIRSNGILTIYIVDNAGNSSQYSYTYGKHGIPQSGKPTVSIDAEGYAKSVTVTINWGAGYDDNPYAEKMYAIVTSTGAFTRSYNSPITIDTEGEVQIIIYYYENGEQKQLPIIIDNVDRTPPSLSIMQTSATIICNVMQQNPVIFTVKATDRLSQIKRVYFKAGGELEKQSNDYYSAPIMDMYSFVVVAEDKAGNTTEYTYNNRYFDFATLKQANQKFLALDRGGYTTEGWAEIEKACNALSMLLMDSMASSSDIAVRSRAIDDAILGSINVTYKTAAFPLGLDSGVIFSLNAADTDALKGETVSVRLEPVSKDSHSKQAGEKSGIKKYWVYPFAVTISGISSDVSLTGSLSLNFALPQGTKCGKIYVVNNDTLKELDCYTEGGRIYATTDTVGDFYLVAERLDGDGIYIGKRLYSWQLLSITGAIIVGVCLVGLVATLVFAKRRRS